MGATKFELLGRCEVGFMARWSFVSPGDKGSQRAIGLIFRPQSILSSTSF